MRLAVTQQTRELSEKLVAAGARHNDVLQPSLARTDVAEGMGMAWRDDRHRSRLGGKDLVTHLDFIRPLQKAKNFELMAMHMERWSGSRTGDFLDDGTGVPCRGRRDLDGDRNPGQGDFLAGVCRDEQVLGLRHTRLQLRVWTARVCRLHVCGAPRRHPLSPTCMAPSAARMATRVRVVSWSRGHAAPSPHSTRDKLREMARPPPA